MVVEHLYQKGTLPQGVNPHKIKQILVFLVHRLVTELAKQHVWLAVASRAVSAGYWRGRRLRDRRIKLLGLINVCNEALNLPPLELEEGWAEEGLYYGYGGYEKWAGERGTTVINCLMLEYLQEVRKCIDNANSAVNPENN